MKSAKQLTLFDMAKKPKPFDENGKSAIVSDPKPKSIETKPKKKVLGEKNDNNQNNKETISSPKLPMAKSDEVMTIDDDDDDDQKKEYLIQRYS